MVKPTEFGTNSVKGFSMTGSVAVPVRLHVPWRALALALLLTSLVGVVLYEGLVAGNGAPATPLASAPGVARVASEARASISAQLGLDIPAYHLVPDTGAFRGANAAQHLRLDFTRSGVLVGSGAARFGLGLRAEGSGSSLHAVNTVTPELERANDIAYLHEAISEWYVNGPLGLEQGFSIARPPAAAAALTLAVGVSGASRVALSADGQSALLRGAGGNALRYGHLSTRDARGRALRTWLTVDGQQLLLHVDARGARFPLVVDPMVEAEPEQKLDAGSERLSNGSSGEVPERSRFGWSVALSADGDTALVGAPGEDSGVGAAWIFTRSGSGWIEQGTKLTIPEGAINGATCSDAQEDAEEEEEGEQPSEEEHHPCHFGRSVALSADGNTAVIGAPRENGNTGAVWIFTRSGPGWSAGSELSSPEPTSKRRFGTSVAVSADGGTLAVGAPRLNGGRVWAFGRSASSWSPLGGPLTGAGEQGEGLFGLSIALSADGETILVGAPADSEQQGAVWAFSRSGAGWEEHGPKLTGGTPTPGARFGTSVALSGDATTALIGARGAENGSGAAWPFSNTGTGWAEQGPALKGEDEVGEGFGGSVALSFDGSVAVVGAAQAETHRGRTWLFERSAASSWGTAQEKLGNGLSGHGQIQFGSGVALSADSETVLVGAHSDGRAGAAWVFGPSPSGENPGGGGGGGGGGNPGGGPPANSQTTDEVSGNSGSLSQLATGSEVVVLSFGPSAHRTCSVSLLSSRITVQAHARALVRLKALGVGTCRGILTLKVKLKPAKRRSLLKPIASVRFSLAAGRVAAVKLALNASGRALLRAGHGHLAASLVVLKSAPAPTQARTAKVRLTRRRAAPAKAPAGR